MRKNIFKAALILLVALTVGGNWAAAQSDYTNSSAWTIKYTPRESVVLGGGGVQFPMVTYSVERFGGGTRASNTIDTLVDIPDNFIVTEGWIDVMTGVEPNTNNTLALSMNSYGDLFQEQSNTLSTAGIYSLLTTNAPVKATAARDLELTLNGTITQGVFKIILGGFLSQ